MPESEELSSTSGQQLVVEPGDEQDHDPIEELEEMWHF